MSVTRLYAYAVPSNKNLTTPAPVQGGPMTDLKTLGSVIDDATQKVRAANWLAVRLNVDATSPNRSSPYRDAVLGLAFGQKPKADASALGLAQRLAGLMDQRSPGGCLLVLAVRTEAGGKTVTMWTFPRDPALRFRTGAGGPTVEVLTDAFSQRSHLRKAAELKGADQGPTSFLTARAVDLISGGPGQAADYWVHDFLDAELSLAGDVGTAALALGLKAAWDTAGSDGEREQFRSAAVAVRASTQSRWSMQSFADSYLTDSAKARFLKTREAREHRAQKFQFKKDAFDLVINYRVFELKNGVYISAPFARADTVLDIKDTPQGKRVTASGVVKTDRVRKQRGV